ncbi:hypothetical protein ACS0TY_001158 [Phlomoides rotata]
MASDNSSLTRHDFPKDFLFGAATSNYQVEGAYKQDGRSLSNWDAFVLQRPGKIIDGSNGCVATDHYNRFKDDVALMKKLGLDTYRLSISWTRILPGGNLCHGVNKEGVKFYNDLINLLLSEGIEPFVTIFHFDVPQCLEEEYGGFLNPKIVQDFGEYANVCFFEFGDRVKYWITENEPWTFTVGGYVNGTFPPARGSPPPDGHAPVAPPRLLPGRDTTLTGGDAGTEPYIVAHHLILAHATAVDIYRKNYQAVQGGKIGVTNMSGWFDPYNETLQDVAAASRAVDFMWGWFVAPIVTGDYPPVMRQRVGKRLPTFEDDDKKLVKGSFDFIGMNYYTTNWVANYDPKTPPKSPTYYTDQGVDFITERDGKPIGPQAGSPWLYIVPYGIHSLLLHTQKQYNDPIIYITENGVDEKNDTSLTVTQARNDDYRIKFHQDHLAYVKKAIDESGAKVKGYILWSLLDNYEWTEGYTVRFGINYVDYANNLIRYPKNSAIWYMNFLNKIKKITS